MAALTKDEVLKKQDARKWERVEVPEWGGAVYVRVMTANERDIISDMFKKSMRGYRATLAAMTLCDENGIDLFDNATPEEIRLLGEKSGQAIDRIVTVAQRLSGLTEESVKEAEKNSETT